MKPDDERDAFFADRRALVDRALDQWCPRVEPVALTEAMRYSLLSPGKRLRPILCLAACEAVGAPPERALGCACAVEMVHAMSLIHDDLPALDNDDLRRGQPTCHRRFGEAVALLAGDALLALAFETLVRRSPGLDPADLARAIQELARAAGPAGVAGGQVMDMLMAHPPIPLSTPPAPAGRLEGRAGPAVETLQEIHLRKTAVLMAASVVLGAVAGGADDQACDAFRRYGTHLGLAFQIVDDILDVTRATEDLGKTAGKDVAAGKATYPARFGVEGSRRLAREQADQAVRALAPLGPAADWLRAIAGVIVGRAD